MASCTPGIYVPLVTPAKDGEHRTFERIAPLIEWHMSCGVTGFYVGGSTGEAFLMPEHERLEFLVAVSQIVSGRRPLIAHVGSVLSGEPERLAAAAADADYTAIASTPPFYYRYDAEEIANYYFRLAETTTLPLIIYNVPSNSGVSFALDMFLTLLDHPKIIGIKHTSPDFSVVERILSCRPGTIVYSGPDQLLCAGLAMGAAGGIGSTYNIFPDLYVELFRSWRDGRHEQALRLQHRLNSVTEAILKASPSAIPGIKAALALIGYDLGPPRPPFRPIDETRIEQIKLAIDSARANP